MDFSLRPISIDMLETKSPITNLNSLNYGLININHGFQNFNGENLITKSKV